MTATQMTDHSRFKFLQKKQTKIIKFATSFKEKEKEEIQSQYRAVTQELKRQKTQTNNVKIWQRTQSFNKPLPDNSILIRRNFLEYKSEQTNESLIQKPFLPKKINQKEKKGFFLKTSKNPEVSLFNNSKYFVKEKGESLLKTALAIIESRNENKAEYNPFRVSKPVTAQVNCSHEVYLMAVRTKIIETEIERLKQEDILNENRVLDSQKKKVKKFSKHRAMYEARQKLMDEANQQVKDISYKKMHIDKELHLKMAVLNSLKNENKKTEERIGYYSVLRTFLDDISPAFYKEKLAKERFFKQPKYLSGSNFENRT